jgi:hypothetical protein
MFDKKDIDAVLETYKGIDPKELADCAEQLAILTDHIERNKRR